MDISEHVVVFQAYKLSDKRWLVSTGVRYAPPRLCPSSRVTRRKLTNRLVDRGIVICLGTRMACNKPQNTIQRCTYCSIPEASVKPSHLTLSGSPRSPASSMTFTFSSSPTRVFSKTSPSSSATSSPAHFMMKAHSIASASLEFRVKA